MTTDELLEVELPVIRYDITMPLLEGKVGVEGVKFKPVKASSMISKEDPELKSGDFGLRDLNVCYFLPAIEAGWQLIGLPVFSKRKPVYQLIFCHRDAGIRQPKDLEGKRIGARTYRTAITGRFNSISRLRSSRAWVRSRESRRSTRKFSKRGPASTPPFISTCLGSK